MKNGCYEKENQLQCRADKGDIDKLLTTTTMLANY
jgi:hypothetical protein